MSYVRRRRERWYIGFKDEAGRWQEEATKARTKTEAKRMAEDKEHQADLVRRGLAAPRSKPMTFDEFATRYLAVSSTPRNRRPWLESRLKHLRSSLGKISSLG